MDLFPNRINLSEQTPLDFICVGCGPLLYEPDYVEVGPPADVLRNDLLFMAKKMGIVYPLLPPTTEREFGMIKEFLKNSPQPKECDISRLCKMFKAASDGVRVFPKIPALIKPAIKRWKISQEIFCYTFLRETRMLISSTISRAKECQSSQYQSLLDVLCPQKTHQSCLQILCLKGSLRHMYHLSAHQLKKNCACGIGHARQWLEASIQLCLVSILRQSD